MLLGLAAARAQHHDMKLVWAPLDGLVVAHPELSHRKVCAWKKVATSLKSVTPWRSSA